MIIYNLLARLPCLCPIKSVIHTVLSNFYRWRCCITLRVALSSTSVAGSGEPGKEPGVGDRCGFCLVTVNPRLRIIRVTRGLTSTGVASYLNQRGRGKLFHICTRFKKKRRERAQSYSSAPAFIMPSSQVRPQAPAPCLYGGMSRYDLLVFPLFSLFCLTTEKQLLSDPEQAGSLIQPFTDFLLSVTVSIYRAGLVWKRAGGRRRRHTTAGAQRRARGLGVNEGQQSGTEGRAAGALQNKGQKTLYLPATINTQAFISVTLV